MRTKTDAHDWEWWRDLEARQEIREWSKLDPEYAEMIQDLKDAIAYKSRTREPSYGQTWDQRMDDESFCDAAAAALGMGTKMLPSNKYRK